MGRFYLSAWTRGIQAVEWGLIILLGWLVGRWAAEAMAPPAAPPPLKIASAADAFFLPADAFVSTSAGQHRAMLTPRRKLTAAQLGVRLVGVIRMSNGTGVAIFERQGHRWVMRTGEKRDDMRLLRIEPDRIVLDYRGEPVWVPLEKSASPAMGSVTTTSNAMPLARIVQSVRKHPLKLFDYVQVEMTPKGARLTPRSGQVALFERFGLRPGDILTGIDGLSLQQVMNTPDLQHKLFNKRHWRLELLRHGMPLTREVDLGS